EPVARLDRGEDLRMRQMHPRPVARLGIGVEDELLSHLQLDRARGEAPDAQLWTLQVGKNADRPAHRLFHRTNTTDQRLQQRMIGMAHIDAEDIRTGQIELLDCGLVRGGWPESSDDLDVAVTPHRPPIPDAVGSVNCTVRLD